MSDSTQVLSDIQIFLQRKTAATAKSDLFEKAPTFELFTGLTEGKEGVDGLGRLSAGMLSFGRINGASASRRLNLEANREYLPLIQTTKPNKDDTKDMGDYDNDPSVPNADTDGKTLARFKQPRFKFSRVKMPAKIWHSEMETAVPGTGSNQKEAAKAIRSVYDVENKGRIGSLCEKLNDRMFGINGASGAPSNEDSVTWDSYHSINNALGTSNQYGGIDRSDNANDWWRGKRFTSTFTGTFEDALEYVNYDWRFLAKGKGTKLILVGGQLMKRAKAEARADSTRMQTQSIPDPTTGFAMEMVTIGAGNKKVYIVYEPSMDAVDTATGKLNAYFLDPSTWSIAIPGQKNFKQNKIIRLNEVQEGGDEADAWNIEHQMMICCEVPSANAVFEDIQ